MLQLWLLFVSNYGPTIAVQNEAAKQGCQQVLWLYGESEEITEVGTMNLFIYWTTKKGGEMVNRFQSASAVEVCGSAAFRPHFHLV